MLAFAHVQRHCIGEPTTICHQGPFVVTAARRISDMVQGEAKHFRAAQVHVILEGEGESQVATRCCCKAKKPRS